MKEEGLWTQSDIDAEWRRDHGMRASYCWELALKGACHDIVFNIFAVFRLLGCCIPQRERGTGSRQGIVVFIMHEYTANKLGPSLPPWNQGRLGPKFDSMTHTVSESSTFLPIFQIYVRLLFGRIKCIPAVKYIFCISCFFPVRLATLHLTLY